MKKILTFLLIFVVFLGFSQKTYSFDFLTKYKITSTKKNCCSERVAYFNTDNFNYSLHLFRNKDEFFAHLVDIETKQYHRFKVIETKKQTDVFFSFQYEKTIRTGYDGSYYKRRNPVFENITDASATLKMFRSKSAKKPEDIIDFEFVKANKNLFPIFRISNYHPYEGLKTIDVHRNVMVKKAKFYCEIDKSIREFTLDEYKNVELDITVPKKLNY